MDDLALAIHQCNSSKISYASSMEGGGGAMPKNCNFLISPYCVVVPIVNMC